MKMMALLILISARLHLLTIDVTGVPFQIHTPLGTLLICLYAPHRNLWSPTDPFALGPGPPGGCAVLERARALSWACN